MYGEGSLIVLRPSKEVSAHLPCHYFLLNGKLASGMPDADLRSPLAVNYDMHELRLVREREMGYVRWHDTNDRRLFAHMWTLCAMLDGMPSIDPLSPNRPLANFLLVPLPAFWCSYCCSPIQLDAQARECCVRVHSGRCDHLDVLAVELPVTHPLKQRLNERWQHEWKGASRTKRNGWLPLLWSCCGADAPNNDDAYLNNGCSTGEHAGSCHR